METPAAEAADPRWFALHTRSRHERKVRAELEALSCEVFLPEYHSWSRRRDRRVRLLRPLFPGYLFVRTAMTPRQRVQLLQARGVVRVVGAGRRPAPVPDRQVESVRLLLSGAQDAAPHSRLRPGALVQVLEGPLRGVIGVVERGEQARRIVVSVELLGRSVSATLDTDALAPYLDPTPGPAFALGSHSERGGP